MPAATSGSDLLRLVAVVLLVLANGFFVAAEFSLVCVRRTRIARYVLGKLSRLPRPNETILADGLRLQVESMDGMRIAQLLLTRLPPPPEPELAGSTPDSKP
jgi:CBS domain containing-hemolysin-like protein